MTPPGPTETTRFGSLKPENWPEQDRRLMAEARRPKGFLKPGGAASDWRAKTLETVTYRYGVFVWWLNETGRLRPDAAPIERVTAENIEAFIEAYGACHASTSLAGVVHGIYEMVRVMHPNAEFDDLRDVVAGLKAVACPRPKLPRMADHRALIELGEALIAHGARKLNEDHMLSAAAVRDGCMILFQVDCPLRRSNFEALQLGETLLRDERGYHVAFKASQMKNHRSFDADLSAWITPRLDFYLDATRPVLQWRSDQPDQGWLWLGAEGEPMTGKSMSRRVRQLITRHLGRAMSLHLFRDGATTTVAVHASADIGIAGDLLGHADDRTSEEHYNQAGGVEAARRYHELLAEQREEEFRRKRPERDDPGSFGSVVPGERR